MNDSKLVTITLLNKDFIIKCPADQTQALQQSAAYLRQKTQQLQKNNIDSTEKLAIVAALNLCHDCLSLKKEKNQRINELTNLQKKIKDSLEIPEEIEL